MVNFPIDKFAINLFSTSIKINGPFKMNIAFATNRQVNLFICTFISLNCETQFQYVMSMERQKGWVTGISASYIGYIRIIIFIFALWKYFVINIKTRPFIETRKIAVKAGGMLMRRSCRILFCHLLFRYCSIFEFRRK